MKKMKTKLKTGSFYWIKCKRENIWRPAIVIEDPNNRQWIDILGTTTLPVNLIKLEKFDFVKLNKPGRKLGRTKNIPKKIFKDLYKFAEELSRSCGDNYGKEKDNLDIILERTKKYYENT